jgi:hypothetical protein
MLDAIASAPFLTVAAPVEEPEEPEEQPEAVAAVPVFEAPRSAPERDIEIKQPAEQPESRPESPPERETADHEIAASPAEAAIAARTEEPQTEAPAVESQQAEQRRHAIHGEPEPAPADPTQGPRRAGWWNRRKTG